MSDINLSFTRNLKCVCWGGTLRLNLLRALGASIIWAIFAFGLGASWTIILAIVPLVPIAHLFLGLPIGIAAHALTEAGFPLANVAGVLVAIVMLPGDPLVYLAARVFRRSFLLQEAHLFQVAPVLLLTRAPDANKQSKEYRVSSLTGGGSGFAE